METLKYRKISDFFNALSHPTRIMILNELLKKEKCVSDIKELAEIKQPNASQHLNILKMHGIVDWRQEGKRKCYFLKNPKLIKKLLESLPKELKGKR